MALRPARVIGAGAGCRRAGVEVIDQALALEAAEDLGDGAALDFECLGQRQDGTVVALRGGAENDGLALADLVMG